MKPYIPVLIEETCKNLSSDYPILIENSLSCLHEVFEILDDKLETINYQPILFQLESLYSKPYKQVRSQAI